ncbi:MAG: glycosyltransferase family 2 protein [Candidatus Nanoarchaeia archaeon]|nr:glycosyltransferase family 2 protein [Candidatus Nanoarchaeia archaeon]
MEKRKEMKENLVDKKNTTKKDVKQSKKNETSKTLKSKTSETESKKKSTNTTKKSTFKYDKNDVYIVVPAYNQEKTIVPVINSLRKEDYNNIIVIDDGSSDNTYKLALKEKVFTLIHKLNLGQGAALQTGFEFALKQKAKVIVTFDSDGQHRAKDIDKIVKPIFEGFDVSLGTRFNQNSQAINMPFSRKVILKGGLLFTKIVSRIDVTDTHNGFRAFSYDALKKIKITFNRMEHASEILDLITKYKLKYKEVPVIIEYSEESLKAGQSSLNAINIASKIIYRKLFGFTKNEKELLKHTKLIRKDSIENAKR